MMVGGGGGWGAGVHVKGVRDYGGIGYIKLISQLLADCSRESDFEEEKMIAIMPYSRLWDANSC